MKVYIAGPFFYEEQLNFIKQIEEKLNSAGIDYFSPRLEGGVLKNMTPEQREEKAEEIYKSNIYGILDSDGVIAVIDNLDPGTIFEIGFCAGANSTDSAVYVPIITLTDNDFGLNVMLSQCSEYHAKTIDDAIDAFIEFYETGEVKNIKRAKTVT